MPEGNGVFSASSAYTLDLSDMPLQCDYGTSSSRPDGDDPDRWGQSMLEANLVSNFSVKSEDICMESCF